MLFVTVTRGTWTAHGYHEGSTVLQTPSKHHLHRRATQITSGNDKSSSTTSTSSTSTSKSSKSTESSTTSGKTTSTTESSSALAKSTTSGTGSTTSKSTSTSSSGSKTTDSSNSSKSSSSSSKSSSSSEVTTTSGNDFPSLTSLSIISTSTQSTSTVTYSYDLLIPNLKAAEDPFIYRTSLPNNLVFIVLGSIIVAILTSFMLWRISCSINARKRAKADSEKYDNSTLFSGSNAGWGSHGWNSSKSSLLDYLTSDLTRFSSHTSVNMLNKTNFSSSDSMTDSTANSNSSQGRSYRNALAGGYTKEAMITTSDDYNQSKGSMYFSPTGSKFHLPWVHRGVDSLLDSDTRVDSLVASSQLDMPGRRGSIIFEHFLNESTEYEEKNVNITEESTPKKSRPPSVLLEKFLDYDFDDD